MRWIALIGIVGPGALLLARLVAFTLHVSRTPQVAWAPAWIIPHLVHALFVIDAAIALGLGILGAVLLRTGSE